MGAAPSAPNMQSPLLFVRRVHPRSRARRPAARGGRRRPQAEVVRSAPDARRTARAARDETGAARRCLGTGHRHRGFGREVLDRDPARDRRPIPALDKNGAAPWLYLRCAGYRRWKPRSPNRRSSLQRPRVALRAPRVDPRHGARRSGGHRGLVGGRCVARRRRADLPKPSKRDRRRSPCCRSST